MSSSSSGSSPGGSGRGLPEAQGGADQDDEDERDGAPARHRDVAQRRTRATSARRSQLLRTTRRSTRRRSSPTPGTIPSRSPARTTRPSSPATARTRRRAPRTTFACPSSRPSRSNAARVAVVADRRAPAEGRAFPRWTMAGSRGHRARRRRATARSRERGMTLLEIMVVMLIISLCWASMIFGSGQLDGARLKRTATMVAGAVQVAFTRATATSKSLRLVFDHRRAQMWLEEGDGPMLVQTKDTTSDRRRSSGDGRRAQGRVRGEAEHHEGARRSAQPHLPRRSRRSGYCGARRRARKGPARSGAASSSARSRSSTTTSRGPRGAHTCTSGRADRPSARRSSCPIGDPIDDGDTLTLIVSPLTGKVTVKNGPVALVIPHRRQGCVRARGQRGGF